jgi:N-acetylglucosaminyldiphosphoundecaprenol N-acetyl-beta-D-mannosaminyltransferase
MLKEIKLTQNREIFLNKINEFCLNNNKGYSCAVNANIIVECFKNKEYLEIIKKSVFNTCDGINVKRLYNALYKDKIELYTGPDLFQDLAFKKEYVHFFLGGQGQVLNGLRTELQKTNKSISNNHFYSPPFLPVDKFDYQFIANLINKQKPDIIWIGLGAPKQEIFMSNLLPYLDRGLMIAVGAAFNFYSGLDKFKQAPDIMKKYHVIWLFRAFQEPKRIIKRQLRSLFYLPLIYFKEIITK